MTTASDSAARAELSNIELGRTGATPEQVAALAALYGVEFDWLKRSVASIGGAP